MGLFGKIFNKFTRNEYSQADEADFKKVLIESDLGSDLTEKVLQAVKTKKGQAVAEAVKEVLRSFFLDTSRNLADSHDLPTVIIIVGINGTGKTTSAAKLAYNLQQKNKKVLLAAADTFRAAAVDQLNTWAIRLNIPIVMGSSGADPASIAFEAATKAVNEKIDYLIIDTAGRLHTKNNLMAELSKIKRVVEKVTPIAEILFVLDGTTGQNGVTQAKVFAESVSLSGIIVTKLDGSAKGGIAFATEVGLGIPIKFIGSGEQVTDFAPFDPEDYLNSLIS